MKVTPRETALGIATLAVALYAGLFYVGWGQRVEWSLQREMRAKSLDSIRASQALVGERAGWEAQLEELQAEMPLFPRDRRMDVHWLSVVEEKAATHGLKILRHEVGAEQREGPIFELPVYCRRWEGTLDALVHFLFDLQSEGAMLDVRYLLIKPKDKETHDGRFDLFCAYRREGV